MKQKYSREYYKKKYRTFVVRFHNEKDKAAIQALTRQEIKIDYIRRLVKNNIQEISKKQDENK